MVGIQHQVCVHQPWQRLDWQRNTLPERLWLDGIDGA